MAKHLYVVLESSAIDAIIKAITDHTESGEYELVSVVSSAAGFGKDWMIGKPKLLIVFREVDLLGGAALRLAEAYSEYFNEGTADQYQKLTDAWQAFESLREG